MAFGYYIPDILSSVISRSGTVTGSPVTTGNVVSLTGMNSLTTGSILNLNSNSSDTGTRNLLQVQNQNTSATGARCLFLNQDANALSMLIDSEATSADVFEILADTVTTGDCINIDNADGLTTGTIARFWSNSSNASTRYLLYVRNDNTLALGTYCGYFHQDAGGVGVGAILISCTAAAMALDIDYSGGNNNGNGVIDIVRSGNFTGTSGNISADVRISPSFTLTEPGSGTHTHRSIMIDMTSVLVTAGAGASIVEGIFIQDAGDADTTNYLFRTVHSAIGQIYIDARTDRTSSTIAAVQVDVDFGADNTVGMVVNGIGRGDYNGTVSFAGQITSGGMLSTGDGCIAIEAQLTNSVNDVANANTIGFATRIVSDAGGSGSLIGFSCNTGYDQCFVAQSGQFVFRDYAGSIVESNSVGAASGISIITAGGVTSGAGGNLSFTTGAGAGSGNNGGDIVFSLGASGGGVGRQGVISGDLRIASDVTMVAASILHTQGTDVASATNLSLGTDGNVFEITGTTQIDLISSTGWQEGAIVTLLFNESLTVRHGIATSGSNITILLSSSANFSATANDTLTLVLSSTTASGQAWREMGRSTI